MRDGWSELPDDLAYLKAPAEAYGHWEFQADRDQLHNEISDDELAALAAVAKRVRAPGENDRIYQWRRSHQDTVASRLITWLIQILQEFVPDIPEDCESLDWDKLPENLRWLKAPACEYGRYWLGEDRLRIGLQFEKEDWDKVNALADRIAVPETQKAMDEWLAANPPFVHGRATATASTLVHIFLSFLDELAPR